MKKINEVCPFCKGPNNEKKVICEWCGMSTETEYSPTLEKEKVENNSIKIEQESYDDELIFKKNGDFKSGMFSKVNGSSFYFFQNRIVVRPSGLNRIFNSADIIIPKNEIIGIEPSFRIIGYNFIIITRSARYWVGFMGDKQKIGELLYSYVLSK